MKSVDWFLNSLKNFRRNTLLRHVQHGAVVLDGEVARGVAPLRGGLGLGRGGVGDLGDEAGVGVGGGDALDEGVQAGGRAVDLVLDDAGAHGGGW